MASRFVRSETTRLPLSDGDWIVVLRRLSAGAERARFARMYLTSGSKDGERTLDLLQVGLSSILAYLVDWSLVDDQGQPVSIRGLSVAELQSVLDNLTPETFGEIREAIERHEEAMTAEREAEKKTTPGAPASPSTSPSPSAAAGVLIGSEP